MIADGKKEQTWRRKLRVGSGSGSSEVGRRDRRKRIPQREEQGKSKLKVDKMTCCMWSLA